MRKYYTRPCNFHYGKSAKILVKSKKALILAGNPNIAFDKIEVFQRIKKGVIKSNIYSISKIKNLKKEIKSTIETDLKKIICKRKSIRGLKFENPEIMGVLNVTPDSFSDGGLFFSQSKAYNQTHLMIKSGAKIIDIGGESTRPGSKVVQDKNEWNRIEKIIVKIKKNFPKIIL